MTGESDFQVVQSRIANNWYWVNLWIATIIYFIAVFPYILSGPQNPVDYVIGLFPWLFNHPVRLIGAVPLLFMMATWIRGDWP